jgi:hypothetical protein
VSRRFQELQQLGPFKRQSDKRSEKGKLHKRSGCGLQVHDASFKNLQQDCCSDFGGTDMIDEAAEPHDVEVDLLEPLRRNAGGLDVASLQALREQQQALVDRPELLPHCKNMRSPGKILLQIIIVIR